MRPGCLLPSFQIGVNGTNMTAAFPRSASFQTLLWRTSVPLCLAGTPATHLPIRFGNGDGGLA